MDIWISLHYSHKSMRKSRHSSTTARADFKSACSLKPRRQRLAHPVLSLSISITTATWTSSTQMATTWTCRRSFPALITACNGWRIWERSEEHTSELQSHSDLVCRLLLEKK